MNDCERGAILAELDESGVGFTPTSLHRVQDIAHFVKRLFCVIIRTVSADTDMLAVNNIGDIIRPNYPLKIVINIHTTPPCEWRN